MRANIPARPEQKQSPLEIINDALRAAALDPEPNGAIDILAGALQRLQPSSKTSEGIHEESLSALIVELQHLHELLSVIVESAPTEETERTFLLAQMGQKITERLLVQLDTARAVPDALAGRGGAA
ncbi:hypothetical protein AWB80_03591 [Caballeronia pedi]|uniref:Uncharacterized protein n=1 Tax=Caballeronia pedi TaxID=1777141 RepID=A0A158BIR7_9BURK|nr:hypothetical protein [Caballeronia pedi]SAK69666.1 hypothetical protein AWB80_03591 [Caballeronia pedi]